MNTGYEGILQFRGKWRDYQERVLLHAQQYLKDGKIHIVAAPGSGKTTLGIELIRRLGAPCLIFSPSITIRQQWLMRIQEGFLTEQADPQEILSNDLKQMKQMTATTYQALYSAMKREQGTLEEDSGEAAEEDAAASEAVDGVDAADSKVAAGGVTEEADGEKETEQVDYRDFDIFKAVKEAGITTICLDEAHHLRSEWWKALETFLDKLPDVKIIALTATPPYDSTPAQWKRYIDMCGPIDEEIFTPELVREGSLCPHQDYVYFNWPTREEEAYVREHQKRMQMQVQKMMADETLRRIVSSHQGLMHPEEYSERFLDKPEYFTALLVYCQAKGIPFSGYLRKLIGTKGKLPGMDAHWMEVLLQGVLYEDRESYTMMEAEREGLLQELKEAGAIYRNKVALRDNEAIKKVLMKSQGKMESIHAIVQAEYEALENDLRLLVLCDYIKKDKLPEIGSKDTLVTELGAVPIFEYLRRQNMAGIRLGVLSGTVIIVPMEVEAKLPELLAQYGCSGTLNPLGDTGYGQLMIKGKSTHTVAVVTELFRQGEIHTLIGTKSLLGEGWDAPCINSLILATYVGSFMLSNQMRGRAIRTDREQPDKTGNIWHLACIFPKERGQQSNTDAEGDYEMLERRFESFLGVSCREDVIESGIGRLDIPKITSKYEVDKANRMMLERAKDRNALRQRWNQSLQEVRNQMEIEQIDEIAAKEIETGYIFINAVCIEIIQVILAILLMSGRMMAQKLGNHPAFLLLGIALLAAFAGIVYQGIRLFKFSTPARRMKQLSKAMLDALRECGELEDGAHCRTEVESFNGLVVGTWLKGGTTRDKTTYSACMEELWGVIDNPRYLLIREKIFGTSRECYSVPEIFGRQKERALIFEKHMKRALGPYHVVYTRTPEGRKLLLKERTRSFVNQNQSLLQGKKIAKGY